MYHMTCRIHTCADEGERREEGATGGTVKPNTFCKSPADESSSSDTVFLILSKMAK